MTEHIGKHWKLGLKDQIMTNKEIAEKILGREIEVDKTTDGKFIVVWINANSSPPPKGDTEEEAIEKFTKWIQEDTRGRLKPITE